MSFISLFTHDCKDIYIIGLTTQSLGCLAAVILKMLVFHGPQNLDQNKCVADLKFWKNIEWILM
jgi:hypothetical protein